MTIENIEQYRDYLEDIISNGIEDFLGGDVESPAGFYAGMEVRNEDRDTDDFPPAGWYLYRRNSDGIVSLFHYETSEEFLKEYDRLEQMNDDAEEAALEEALEALIVGTKVKIMMGLDEGKTGVVVPRGQVPLRDGGIPMIGKGHYKPMDHKSVAIRLDHDGSLDVYSLWHLQVVENTVTGSITLTLEMPEDKYIQFMVELRDLLYKQSNPDTTLVVDPQITFKK